MSLDDCYRTLEVPPTATDDEVRRAHRQLIQVWHPDRFGHDAALRAKADARTREINEAYETIREAREGGYRRPRPEPKQQPQMSAEERALRRRAARRSWAFWLALTACLLLLRRPSGYAVIAAVVLLCVAAILLVPRRAARE